MIERNQFFESRKTKITQLNANLSNSVKEQYEMARSSFGKSNAAIVASRYEADFRKRKA